MKLTFNAERLGRFCRERGIARLELFGSALGDDFRAESDVDLLATLRTDAHLRARAKRSGWRTPRQGPASPRRHRSR